MTASCRSKLISAVLFNYRYNPCHWKVEEVISSGKIGNVKSVHFEWLLVSSRVQSDERRADLQDTVHGADYFRRWHRYKDRSGGLMVHKSSHHVRPSLILRSIAR